MSVEEVLHTMTQDTRERIEKTDVIIVDEVSMISKKVLDQVRINFLSYRPEIHTDWWAESRQTDRRTDSHSDWNTQERR